MRRPGDVDRAHRATAAPTVDVHCGKGVARNERPTTATLGSEHRMHGPLQSARRCRRATSRSQHVWTLRATDSLAAIANQDASALEVAKRSRCTNSRGPSKQARSARLEPSVNARRCSAEQVNKHNKPQQTSPRSANPTKFVRAQEETSITPCVQRQQAAHSCVSSDPKWRCDVASLGAARSRHRRRCCALRHVMDA